MISIHALREEGDATVFNAAEREKHFYPRPPRGGRHKTRRRERSRQNISIHALREEGDAGPGYGDLLAENFYPRPPRGGRRTNGARARLPFLFLSTPSARRATRLFDGLSEPFYISIHALREEGDPYNGSMFTKSFEISIHALREEGDPPVPVLRLLRLLFLSTPSARRATPSETLLALELAFLSTPSARRATL